MEQEEELVPSVASGDTEKEEEELLNSVKPNNLKNISDHTNDVALKRKSPSAYGSEKKIRIEGDIENDDPLIEEPVVEQNPNDNESQKSPIIETNGQYEVMKTEMESPPIDEQNGQGVGVPWRDGADMTISEKLREMDEITLQPVSKNDIKTKQLDAEIVDEVSLEITRKGKLDPDLDPENKHKVTNLRKNIRDVMDDTKLDVTTLVAQREESERLARLARVQEQQKTLRALQRQSNLDKVHDHVLSLLTEAKSGSVSGNLTPSVSIAPVRVLDKKTGQILEEVPSINESVSVPETTSPSAEYDKDPLSEEGEIDDKTESVCPVVVEKKDVVTIDDSSDDDCILLSDEEEEEDGDDDPHNCGLHVNDTYNVADDQGRVLVNVGHPENEPDVFVAPQIARIIKPHQIGGVRFLYDNIIESLDRFDTSAGFGCILAHSMGLGKTLQLVTFCDIFLRHTSSKTVLCIMPINTLQNWMAEFNMWLPENPDTCSLKDQGEVRPRTFKIHVLNDSHKSLSARSKVVFNWSKEGGVLMIGYEMYRLLCLKKATKKKGKRAMRNPILAQEETDAHNRLLEDIYQALVKPGPDLVVCDEGHRIKNSHASTSVALKQIRSKRRIVLTGYPLQNNLLEYWCMVDFVRPNYLGTKTEFCNMFEKPIQNGQCIDSTPQDIKLMRYRAHVLHSLLLGFVQRRSHVVLQTSLPKKEECVLLIRMTEFQRKLYDVFMNEVVRTKAVPNPLKAFAVCCKIWNHPDVLYNFLKKRELDLDLELEEAEAALAIEAEKIAKAKTVKDVKNAPNGQDKTDGDLKDVKVKEEIIKETTLTPNLSDPLKSQSDDKTVMTNYGNYNSTHYGTGGYQQYPNNQQYNNPNGYYGNYNNNQPYQQHQPPPPSQQGGSSDQNYYNNQYYNQNYNSKTPSYWSNESTYFNQNSYPQTVNNYNYQANNSFGENQSYQYNNNGTVPVESGSVKLEKDNSSESVLKDQEPTAPKTPDMVKTDTESVKETSEKEAIVKVHKDDGIPYEWATELMNGYVPDLLENSPKMEVFFCILEKSLSLNDRILVFSQSLLTLNLIELYLQRTKVSGSEEFWAKNTNYFRLDGSTSACDREKLINEFNANDKIYLFLVSTRAGSLGINLVGANRVIVFDASWNPCHDTQAVCRVYRYGQKKQCFVYRLVMDNCLEKRIYDRQVNKQGMSDRVVDECNPDARLSIKEVTNLCWDDEKDSEVKDFADIKDTFTDLVMQTVLVDFSKSLSKEPFRHESLLVDRKEKKLSSAEKRLAQRGYELEKKAAAKPSCAYNASGKVTQYRMFRTADGTLVHRPLASVQPLQSENSSVRWIPAEVWQRQGMSTQETTLPADVVIPSNNEDKSGGFVLKAGQRVMILKSTKGIYMQLESGKIIAIKTGAKTTPAKTDGIPTRPIPVGNGCNSNEVIKLDDDDEDEEDEEEETENKASSSTTGKASLTVPVVVPQATVPPEVIPEKVNAPPLPEPRLSSTVTPKMETKQSGLAVANPQQTYYQNPHATSGYGQNFNTQYRQPAAYQSQYSGYNSGNAGLKTEASSSSQDYSRYNYQNVGSGLNNQPPGKAPHKYEYPATQSAGQHDDNRKIDSAGYQYQLPATSQTYAKPNAEPLASSYPVVESSSSRSYSSVPERDPQFYGAPEKQYYHPHSTHLPPFQAPPPAPTSNPMYTGSNSGQSYYPRATSNNAMGSTHYTNANVNQNNIPETTSLNNSSANPANTSSFAKDQQRRDLSATHQPILPLPGEYNPNHPPYYTTPLNSGGYAQYPHPGNNYQQNLGGSSSTSYFGSYNGAAAPPPPTSSRTDGVRGKWLPSKEDSPFDLDLNDYV